MVLRRTHLALLAVLVPLAAGCGTAGLRDAVSLDPVASAATKTTKISSVHFSFDGSFSGPWAGQEFSFNGTGAVDSAAGVGSMHFKFHVPPAASGSLGSTVPTMDMVVQSKPALAVYMSSPMFARTLPTAKPWLKLDLSKLAAAKRLGAFQNLNQTDPSQTLAYLEGAGSSQELGYDRVRGVFTKRYALTIDLARLAKGNRQLQQALKQLKGMTGTKLPAEAWVDDQGLLRKLTLNFTLMNTPDGPFRMSLSEELYDFGAAVHVQLPPANDVTDVTQLLGQH